MKILHTADLHLGKKLFSYERLDEQRAALEEIARLAIDNRVDVVIAAGDIFDTSVPPSLAEELFYNSAVSFAKNGIAFVALAGNHDDELRLRAPSNIAKALDIFLVGGYDNSIYNKNGIEGGDGYLRIKRNGETLNLAIMPYPRYTRLAEGNDKETPYEELVKNRLAQCAECFTSDGINVLAAHLYVGGAVLEDELSDENQLGTASLMPKSILPKADYIALGHIHKPSCVSKTQNAYYSGSLLSYSFTSTMQKSVIIVDINFEKSGKKITKINRIPLTSAKKLIKATCISYMEALETLKNNPDALVQIEYDGDIPLKASEITELKKQPSLVNIENKYREHKAKKTFTARTDKELFCDFYKLKNKTTKEPRSELVDMFLQVLNSEVSQ